MKIERLIAVAAAVAFAAAGLNAQTAGGGAILIAFGAAALIFSFMKGGFYLPIILASVILMGWGAIRLVCGLYYQKKIEKLVKKYKKH